MQVQPSLGFIFVNFSETFCLSSCQKAHSSYAPPPLCKTQVLNWHLARQVCVHFVKRSTRGPQRLADCGLHPCIARCSQGKALAQLAHMVSKSCVGGTYLVTSENFYTFYKYIFLAIAGCSFVLSAASNNSNPFYYSYFHLLTRAGCIISQPRLWPV